MSGTFGYELNLMNLSEEEKQEIREQIAEYKSYAPIIQNGLYYRLSNPTEKKSVHGSMFILMKKSRAKYF